jgi:23S rRNA (adenine2503-C2)-methyltransferase
MKRAAITDVPIERMPSTAEMLGLKPYAASQIIRWLYKRRVSSFDEMTNLSKDARDALKKGYTIGHLKIEKLHSARDGTKKYLFKLEDGKKIESVLIPALDGRVTLCISTQVGCAMGCSFCRTARMGFERDLTQGEILGQVIEVERDIAPVPAPTRGRAGERGPITNVVLMGMGEPFVNYDAVSNAVKVLLDERAFNFSKRRVTVSTSGLVSQAERFSKQAGVKIAISLNATTDEVRDNLMPVNRRFPISEIMKFCRDYSKRSKHRVTFEYVMIKGINDTEEDKKRLVKLLSGIRAKINLIPFNPFPGCDYKGPSETTLREWQNYLTNKGIQTNIRVSRGQEILAACGQLAA